jgi:hypothetical protein
MHEFRTRSMVDGNVEFRLTPEDSGAGGTILLQEARTEHFDGNLGHPRTVARK